MTLVPELETARLRLREWRAADLDPLHAFYCDPLSAEVYGGSPSRDDVWRRIALLLGHWRLRGYGIWALEEKASGEFAGYAGLWFPLEFAEPEVGWGVSPGHRGRGYAGEAAARARTYGFDTAGLDRLVSYILPANRASIRVATRLGAAADGEFELHGRPHLVFRHPQPTQH